MAGPVLIQSSGHKVHAAGGVRDDGEEGGEAPHQSEHDILPSDRSVYGIPAVTSRGIGEMGNDFERAGPDWDTQKRQVLVTQTRQGHSVSYDTPSLHTIPEGGLQ